VSAKLIPADDTSTGVLESRRRVGGLVGGADVGAGRDDLIDAVEDVVGKRAPASWAVHARGMPQLSPLASVVGTRSVRR
jgi:hypothetical protein